MGNLDEMPVPTKVIKLSRAKWREGLDILTQLNSPLSEVETWRLLKEWWKIKGGKRCSFCEFSHQLVGIMRTSRTKKEHTIIGCCHCPLLDEKRQLCIWEWESLDHLIRFEPFERGYVGVCADLISSIMKKVNKVNTTSFPFLED